MVQGLRLCVPKAGGPGSIPGLGTRYHMAQLRVCMLLAATKTQHSQINKFLNKKLDLFASRTQPRVSGGEWPRVVPEDLGGGWGVAAGFSYLCLLDLAIVHSAFSLATCLEAGS